MIIELNKDIAATLSKTELRIIHFINEHQERIPEMSIVDIGFETFSSPASVSRAIRKCGLNGFNELRYKLISHAGTYDIQQMGEIINKSLIEAQRVIEQISVSTILDIIKRLKKTKRIFVYGRGLTEYVTEEFALKLQLLNFNAVAIRDPNIMRIKSKEMNASDMLFIFSLNGNTQELIDSAINASIHNTQIISCTCNPDSTLVELSTHTIFGYKNNNVSIKTYEVASRLPLYMLSRIIIDYIASYQ